MIEQTERLLAVERPAGKQIAVAHAKPNLDVNAVRIASLDERRPQPIIYILVGHVTDHIRTPVDGVILIVCEALLHPLDCRLVIEGEKENGKRTRKS